jgi:hypothetical protein
MKKLKFRFSFVSKLLLLLLFEIINYIIIYPIQLLYQIKKNIRCILILIIYDIMIKLFSHLFIFSKIKYLEYIFLRI